MVSSSIFIIGINLFLLSYKRQLSIIMIIIIIIIISSSSSIVIVVVIKLQYVIITLIFNF